ncbi:MAG: hypothetical protein EA406_10595 [Rhodospirillales bacterium]|nr:MAG: hypothetical protein EA406_10595 [Rhodospirillales bacterium]
MTRHEALQAISMAVSERFCHLGRDAARAVVARYNTEWLVEKNGLVSPKAARERWMAANPKQAASCKPLSRKPGSRQE